MTLSWLKINKMALPVEDVKVDHVAKVGNMTKGFLPHCCPGDFPEEPEKAVEKLHPFLGLWYKEKLKKPEARKALGIANRKLSVLEKDIVLGRLQIYRQWLQRKKKNTKNGEKTEVAILHVLKGFEKEHGKEPEEGLKPAKRLRRKTPQKEIQPLESAAAAAAEPEEGNVEPARKKAIIIASPASPGQDSNVSSVASVKTISSSSSGHIAADALTKQAWKRPASPSLSTKKPAMAKKKPGKKAISGVTRYKWMASLSFGWVKQTKATEKAYIQAKDELESKAYCLVNVSLRKGPEQDQVMETLMAEVVKEGLQKAKVKEIKNSLLKRL